MRVKMIQYVSPFVWMRIKCGFCSHFVYSRLSLFLPISLSPLRLFFTYVLKEQFNGKIVCCWNSTRTKKNGKVNVIFWKRTESSRSFLLIRWENSQIGRQCKTVKILRLTAISTKWNDVFLISKNHSQLDAGARGSFKCRHIFALTLIIHLFFVFFFSYPNEFPFVNSLSIFFLPFCLSHTLQLFLFFFTLRCNYLHHHSDISLECMNTKKKHEFASHGFGSCHPRPHCHRRCFSKYLYIAIQVEPFGLETCFHSTPFFNIFRMKSVFVSDNLRMLLLHTYTCK